MDYFERLQSHTGKAHGRRRVMRDIRAPGDAPRPPSRVPGALPQPPFVPPLPPEEIMPPVPSSVPPGDVPFLRRREPETPTVELGGFTPAEPTIHTWEPGSRRRERFVRRAIASGIVLALATGFALPTFVFPKLSVTIIPKVEAVPLAPQELGADTAATEVDAAAKRLPALLITLERANSREYESTGKKFIKERARGTVTIANAYSSSPQALVASTRLQDGEGRIFRLVRALVVPGATVANGKTVPSTVDAEVVADEVGERYNIGPAEFRIPGFRGTPKYDAFTAKSSAPMAGGYEGEARVVTAADLARASEDITAALVHELEQELEEKVPAGDDFLVPAGARQVAITAIEAPAVDEHRDRFAVRAAATGHLFTLRRSHLADILRTTALPEAPPGTVAVIPMAQPGLVAASARLLPNGKELRFTVSGGLSYYFETDTNEVERMFRDASPGDAIEILLARLEVASVRIKRFPRWLWFVPGRTGGLAISTEAPLPAAE